MRTNFLFTSESVTEGHPDKLCDQISDAIVDSFLQRDPYSRVIAECAVSTGILFLATRFASVAKPEIPEVARQVVEQVGYTQAVFSARDCTIMNTLQELPLSAYAPQDEMDMDDTQIEHLTPRNSATVFGYACDQTASLMPLPISLAHRLSRRLSSVRHQRLMPYLAPDGQSQIGIEYRDRRPARVHSIMLMVSQLDETAPAMDRLHRDLVEQVIEPVFEFEPVKPDRSTQMWINPCGPVILGGPALHAGLTGRKNAVDTYGDYSRNSGSALSGKDPSRIDRVGAYAARHAAKNVVAAGLATECEVQLSYTIGLARPVSLQIETFGTGRVDDEEIRKRIEANFDFRLGAIIRRFRLRHLPAAVKGGFYRKLAVYGHVGRQDIGLPWEQTNLADALRQH